MIHQNADLKVEYVFTSKATATSQKFELNTN